MAADRLFVGYETAFWIWRKAGAMAARALTPTRVCSLAGGAPTQAKIDSFRAEHPDLSLDRIDVLVRPGDQRNLPGVKTHVISRKLPDRSFYRLDDGLYVASPELTLIQLASKLTVAQALKLALEMCGGYAIDDSTSGFYDDSPYEEDEDDGICKRPPLTSTRKLAAYAEKLYRPGSRARGVAFLRWLADGSASPRETILHMLLCLPPRFGGYGLALPELNRRIDFTASERLVMGVDYFVCDLYWRALNKHTAAEYDSKKYHTAEEKQERDAIRRNLLQYKNIRVITVTRRDVNSLVQFDRLARQIARAIGKRLRTPKKEHVAARRELRKTLFEWDLLDNSRSQRD